MRKLILIVSLASLLPVAGCSRQPSRSTSQPPPGSSAASQIPPAGGQPGAGNAGPSQPSPPREPAWQEVTIPAGTHFPIRLEQALASDSSRVDEPVTATVLSSVIIRGITVVQAGSTVDGVVTGARRSGRVKGRAELRVRFDTLLVKGDAQQYTIRTGLVTRRAPATHKKDALEIGVPAIGGAVIGGILGGKKGALVGGTVGGGAGSAVVLSTRGQEVRLPRGTHLAVKLLAPVTVRVRA
jgi:hypothetical protein